MIYKESFLNELLRQKIQNKYAKITLLDWGERPIKSLEGQITGGNINVDGNSAIRTTISLSMVVKDLDLTKFTIALRSKISVEIGLENNIDDSYEKIIWFKQGIFIVTNFNTSIGTSLSTLSISGKDKMCLLNGEISGSVPSSIDFGQIDTYENSYVELPMVDYSPEMYYYKETLDNGKDFYFLDYSPEQTEGRKYYEKKSSVTTTKLTIKEIIYNMIYIWGHESKTKIIINDLDLMGNELLEYRGEEPMYLIKEKDTNSNIFRNLIFDSSYVVDGEPLKDWNEGEFYSLNTLDLTNSVREFEINETFYVVVKINYGETMGYRTTDLTFAGDLIAAPGESVVSVLDKIKNMLGNFEYFYDVYGNFIFLAKHAYELVNYDKFLTDGNSEVYLDGSFYNNKIIYTFNDEELNTLISHTPNLTNLRNDYSIWGERTSSSGTKNLIHLRYALQKKPEFYITIGDGPRSGLILKTSPNNYTEMKNSNDAFLKAYDLQVTLNSTIKEIKDETSAELEEIEQEISNLYYKYTESKNGIDGIKRILDIIKTKYKVKWYNKNKDPSSGYVGIYIYNVFKDNLAKSKLWFEKLAQKHDLIVETGYSLLFKVIDLIYNDLKNGVITLDELSTQGVFSNAPIKMANLSLIAINPHEKILNLKQKFVWHNLFKFDYENYNNNEVLEQYNKDWNITYYYIYNEMMDYYAKTISETLKNLTIYLQEKNYFNAIVSILKIWLVKNYLLYIETFAKIDRSLKYNAEAIGTITYEGTDGEEISEEIYDDTSYTYIKTGIGYNFGKKYPGYTEFMTSKYGKEYFLDYWLMLNIDRFKKFSEISSVLQLILEQINLLKEVKTRLANDLHEAEINYYNEINNLIFTIKENSIPLIVDWRELIYQMSRDFYDYNENSKYNYLLMLIENNRTMLQDDYSTGYEVFYTDLISNWRSLYYNPLLESIEYNLKNATGYSIEDYDKENNWLISVKKQPSSTNFWFDLTEGQEGLNEYTISKVGDRLKTVKDSKIRAIYYKDTPNILYSNDNYLNITTENYNTNSYTYFLLGGELSNLYTLSSLGKSAFDELQDLLYKFTYCTENITITSLPIYILKPNYRIMVYSKTPGLSGEFIINKISIPLIYNGMMSINATKAVPYLGIN